MEPAEDDLVARAVAGDRDCLTALLESVGLQVHCEIERKIGGPYRGLVEADDVMQVTCLEAFLRIGQFVPGGPGSFLAWLRRISDNNLRDAIRELERDKRPSPARRMTIPAIEESYAGLLERVAGTTTTATRAAARGELRQILDEALHKLPPDYEQVLRLYELEELSGPEVAGRMGRSHGAVRMLLARARECLAELLGSESRYL